jgi:hypothetical protein
MRGFWPELPGNEFTWACGPPIDMKNWAESTHVRRRTRSRSSGDFATLLSDRLRLSIWFWEKGVQEAVMESTAQYWRSVWLELEPHMRLPLARGFSNRAPRGRKHDFKDAERLVRRVSADELILSFRGQRRAAHLAKHDTDEDAAHARPGTLAEPDGMFA